MYCGLMERETCCASKTAIDLYHGFFLSYHHSPPTDERDHENGELTIRATAGHDWVVLDVRAAMCARNVS